MHYLQLKYRWLSFTFQSFSFFVAALAGMKHQVDGKIDLGVDVKNFYTVSLTFSTLEYLSVGSFIGLV
jgi:hypothetical protein